MVESLLTDSAHYHNFVADRDRALERIHQHAQMDIAQYLQSLFKQVLMVASHLSLQTNATLLNYQTLSHDFGRHLTDLITMIFPQIVTRIERMRHATYVMTYASEIAAIGQATKRRFKGGGWNPEFPGLSRQDIQDKTKSPTLLGEDLNKRVWYNLQKLQSRMQQAFSLALVQQLPPKEIVQKVKDSFPLLQVYKRAPKVLKKTREANLFGGDDDDEDKPKVDYTASIIDEGDWELARSAYIASELPPSRFEPGANWDPESGTFKYNWELEQDLMDDFVKQVRDGQVQAANDLGIQEFVWIAILDEKTDECCVKRHGKTTSEIEAMLEDGQLDSSECDSSVPPAHPNCRCQIGPVASTDEVEGPDFQAFGDWLKS